MPTDAATIVSTGLGVGLFAGVLSGVCYVLVQGFSRKRNWNPTLHWYCSVCGRRFRSNLAGRATTCTECEDRVCKTRCSKRDYVTKEWICHNCLGSSTSLNNSLFTSIINCLKKISLPTNAVLRNSGRIMGKRLDDDGLCSEEDREYVRDFIETLVSTIIGESVDDASIFRMYNDKNYVALFNKYHRDLSEAITKLSLALQTSMKNASFSEQNPSSAHTNLKLLIEKILSETTHLPRFRRPVSRPTTPEEVTYEDLLATAVLNKIINKKEIGSAPTLENTNEEIPGKYRREDEAWRTRHKKFDTPSASSVEDYVHSDSSQSSSDYVDRVSLTIHQQIEDIPPAKRRNSPRKSSTRSSLISHSSNWSLQKRQFHDSHSPLPVPMLVPNPLTSAKVLIGDREADETSDLSDANSDHEDGTFASPNGQLLIDSTLTIEQKIPSYVSDEETSFDSGVREDRDDFNDKEAFYFTEHTNISFDSEHEKVASLSSQASNVERDSEYLEHYSSLPNITLTNTSTHSFQPSKSIYDTSANSDQTVDQQGPKQKLSKDETDELPVFEGSYTKKEKEKWKHPVKMAYNPYSEENIRKRIHTNERFGRDYYTKQASLPSGRTKSDEIFDFVPSDEDTALYRAEPVTTFSSNTDFETQEYGSINRLNPEDTYEANLDSNFRFNHFENSQPNYFETVNAFDDTSNNNEITVTIQVNDKAPVFISSDELPKLTIESKIPQDDAKSSDTILNDKAEKIVTTNKVIITQEALPPARTRIASASDEPLFKDTQKSTSDDLLDDTKKIVTTNKIVVTQETLPPTRSRIVSASNGPLLKEMQKDTSADWLDDSKRIVTTNQIVVTQEVPPPTRSRIKSASSELLLKETQDTSPISPVIVSKKSDNTWIRKIYSNPIVRNFALTTRDKIPGMADEKIDKERSEQFNRKPDTPSQPVKEVNLIRPSVREVETKKDESIQEKTSSPDLDHSENLPEYTKSPRKDVAQRHHFSLEFSDNEEPPEEKTNTFIDNDVNELRERRLVASRLGQFSKSFPSLTKTALFTNHHQSDSVEEVSLGESLDQQTSNTFDQPTKDEEPAKVEEQTKDVDVAEITNFVSVKDLKKLFEKSDVTRYNKDKPVHSLTARSISKEIKTRLQ